MSRLLKLLSGFVLLVSCNKDKQEVMISPKPEISIFYGLECGWGSYLDSLYILDDSLFIRENRYDRPAHNFDTALHLSNPEIRSIRNKLNWNSFTKLSYAHGRLDRDGCNCWLKVRKDTAFHEIWYIPHEDDLSSIEPVLASLDSLWNQFGSVPAPLRRP